MWLKTCLVCQAEKGSGHNRRKRNVQGARKYQCFVALEASKWYDQCFYGHIVHKTEVDKQLQLVSCWMWHFWSKAPSFLKATTTQSIICEAFMLSDIKEKWGLKVEELVFISSRNL